MYRAFVSTRERNKQQPNLDANICCKYMPPLKNCSLEKYEKINFKPGKYFRDNGAGGLLLNFFLKSTEFAAYGEGLPTAYSLQCVVLCGSVGHIGGFTPGFTTHSDWTATLPSRVEIKALYIYDNSIIYAPLTSFYK